MLRVRLVFGRGLGWFRGVSLKAGFVMVFSPVLEPQNAALFSKNGNNFALPGQGPISALKLRRWLWSNSSLREPSRCGRVRCSEYVEVRVGPKGLRFIGFCRCHSVWACPVCAPIIRRGRGFELSSGLRSWVSDGHAVVFVTLTRPHDWGDALEPMFRGVSVAWSSVLMDFSVKKFRASHPFAFVRAVEVTLGINGWHPHLHCLMLTERAWTRDERLEFRDVVFRAYCSAIERQGFGAPSPVYGIKVIQARGVDEAGRLGEYESKNLDGLGQELTALASKQARKGLAPFQLLGRAASGNASAKVLWHEYEQATFGRRSLTWSRGARDLLRLGVELSDDEVSDSLMKPSDEHGGFMGALDCEVYGRHRDPDQILWEVLRDDPSPEAFRFAIDSMYASFSVDQLPFWHPGRAGVVARQAEIAGGVLLSSLGSQLEFFAEEVF